MPGASAGASVGEPVVARRAVARRVALRAAPAVASAVSAWLGAPREAVIAATAVALLISVALAARRWGRGFLDGALLVTGGILVVAVLVGSVLNYVPGGITTRSWVVGAAVLDVVVVMATRSTALPAARGRRSHLALPGGFGWYAAGVIVVALGFAMSINAEVQSQKAPPALAVTSESPTALTVTVTSGIPTSPLLLVERVAGAQHLLRVDMSVDKRHPLRLRVHVTAGQTVDLLLLRADVNPPDQLARVIVHVPPRAAG